MLNGGIVIGKSRDFGQNKGDKDMGIYVYNVKITGIQPIHNLGTYQDIELEDKTLGSIYASERFIKWWFNDLDTFETFGFNARTLFDYYGDDGGDMVFSYMSCGHFATGLEALPAEKIRQACPILKEFYGFRIEIRQIEVLESCWQPHGKHWKE